MLIQKNFEKLKFLLSKLNYAFKSICLSETWCKDEKSIPQLQNYKFIHQGRQQNKKGGRVLIFVHKSLNFKIKTDLNISNEDVESLAVEILNRTTKNIIVNLLYRPPAGKIKPFKSVIKQLLRTNEKTRKSVYLIGDFNLNVLDYETNTKVKNFFNLIFQHGLIAVINKPTRVTRQSATAIDHIITNSTSLAHIITGIIKTDITDHMPIFLINQQNNINTYTEDTYIFKRYIKEKSINNFKTIIANNNWEYIKKHHLS